MARTQGRSALNVKWGICNNTTKDENGKMCSKCEQKEKQSIRAGKDFVCEECGKPLIPTTPPKPKGNGKLIAIIAAAVLAIGGGVYFVTRGTSTEKTTEVTTTTEDTTTTLETPTGEGQGKGGKKKPPTQDPVVQQPEILKYATYDGPRKNGVPHGIGGELNFHHSYSLDQKTGNGDREEINSGDIIFNTKFKDGRLVQGTIRRNNGEQKSFTIY